MTPVDNTVEPENLAQLIKRIEDEYNVSQSDIARAIDKAPATVNSWFHGKRRPKVEALRALHRAYPKFSEDRIFAAAERAAPGPLDVDAEARLLDLFRGLTEDQQKSKLIEMSALNEANKR